MLIVSDSITIPTGQTISNFVITTKKSYSVTGIASPNGYTQYQIFTQLYYYVSEQARRDELQPVYTTGFYVNITPSQLNTNIFPIIYAAIIEKYGFQSVREGGIAHSLSETQYIAANTASSEAKNALDQLSASIAEAKSNEVKLQSELDNSTAQMNECNARLSSAQSAVQLAANNLATMQQVESKSIEELATSYATLQLCTTNLQVAQNAVQTKINEISLTQASITNINSQITDNLALLADDPNNSTVAAQLTQNQVDLQTLNSVLTTQQESLVGLQNNQTTAQASFSAARLNFNNITVPAIGSMQQGSTQQGSNTALTDAALNALINAQLVLETALIEYNAAYTAHSILSAQGLIQINATLLANLQSQLSSYITQYDDAKRNCLLLTQITLSKAQAVLNEKNEECATYTSLHNNVLNNISLLNTAIASLESLIATLQNR